MESRRIKCISIHAPREGSDTLQKYKAAKAKLISIHAPREGSDYPPELDHLPVIYFNPRSP